MMRNDVADDANHRRSKPAGDDSGDDATRRATDRGATTPAAKAACYCKVAARVGLWLWIGSLALVSLSRFASSLEWRIDLLASVSYFALAPALLTAVVLLILRRWRRGVVCVMIALVAAWPVLPQIAPEIRGSARGAPGGAVSGQSVEARPADGGNDISLFLCNIYAMSPDLPAVIDAIIREDPDIIILVEAGMHRTRPFVDHDTLAARYPFAQAPRRGATWPILILSRWPIHTLDFESSQLPNETAEDSSAADRSKHEDLFAWRRSVFIDAPAPQNGGAGRFLLTATHPPSPRTAESWREGNETIRLLCELINSEFRDARVPIIVAGDFNTTPAGHRFRMMRSLTDLHPALYGPASFAGTWPSHLPSFLRLSLDQVWGSAEIEFIERRVLEDVGSDHRPLFVRFRVRGKRH